MKDESLYGVDSGDLKAALAKLDSDYPLLKDLSDRVNNQEGIKKWIETRPKTPM